MRNRSFAGAGKKERSDHDVIACGLSGGVCRGQSSSIDSADDHDHNIIRNLGEL